MEADESGTHAQLRNARKEVIDPAIAVNSGRTFKTMGDGFLVAFASAQAAVACAVAIQQDMGPAQCPHARWIPHRFPMPPLLIKQTRATDTSTKSTLTISLLHGAA
jgi:hypothetical protein